MVSIQLLLGGHSFSADACAALIAAGDAPVQVVVNTHKVTLVPVPEFEEDMAEEYLAMAGLGCDDVECAVCSEPQEGCVAVMAVAAGAVAQINAISGGRAHFTTPLLDAAHDAEPDNISAKVIDGVCYMRYADRGLKMAEAVRTHSAEDTLYYMLSVCELLGGGARTTVNICGGKQTCKLLKRYFKRVVCE